MLPEIKKLLLIPNHKLARFCVWMVIIILPPLSVFANEIRPSFKSLRYEENYQFLRDPIERTDLFDSFKYIPLDESDSLYLTLGGETRQHYEFISNNNWG